MNPISATRGDKTKLSPAEYESWQLCERDYNHFFEKYTPEFADYEQMKEMATKHVEESITNFATGHDLMHPLMHLFYVWCRSNMDNLDLLMDLRLLALMGEWGDYREMDDVEYFLVYKYGPF